MDETTGTQAAAAALEAARNAEVSRIAQINQLAAAHGMTSKASKWIAEGVTVEAVKDQILAGLNPMPIAQPSAERGTIQIVAEEHDKLPAGLLFGRTLRAVAGAKTFGMTPARFATNVLRDPALGQRFSAAADPQDASSLAGGGFLIPENMMASVIELLRPKSVVRSLNPTLAPLVNGQLVLPKLTSGVTANYMGENKPITPSKVKGGQVKATAKKLAILVPISNDLLRYASMAADTIVRDDSVRAMAQAEDIAFIPRCGHAVHPERVGGTGRSRRRATRRRRSAPTS
jgi:HK97 family phage major capsid protein